MRKLNAHQHPEEFWSRVNVAGPNECWNWTQITCGQRGKYAQFKFYSTRKQYMVHRIAYHLAKEPIPLDIPKDRKAFGFVLHTCDNGLCCNPAHLFLGTLKDNALDMHKKKRHPIAKLSVEQVKEIRQRRAKGESFRTIAEFFGVDYRAIWMAVNRVTYTYVE